MVSVTGVRLARWYEMGITDYEDLQWLLEFYYRIEMPLSVLGGALVEGRRALTEVRHERWMRRLQRD